MSALNRWSLCLGVLITSGSTSALLGASAGQGKLWTKPPESVAKVELNQPSAGQPFDPQNIGLVSRASKLFGKKVEDDFGRRLGTMEDVLVDLESGRIAACIVSVGGQLKLVPPGAFFPVGEDRIVFNKDRASLRKAPLYAGSFSREAMNRAYDYFGVAGSSPWTTAAADSARSLRGKSITGSSEQVLGRVQDVALDVPKGRVVYVLVQPRNDKSQLQVVPPEVLRFESERGNLALAVDEQRFLSGPKVPARFWTQVTVPAFATSVYNHYGQPIKKQEHVLTPTGRSDEEVRSAILSEIVNSPSLAAVSARDLNISVQNGRARLSGTVGSKSARDDIVDFASRVVGAANVEDQLTIK